ncbi:MAG: hypothetical protein K2I56_07740, partial [Muribaculaceae bacterium]|nr:hypothetical protein [Muribaculaceae bacterium]
MANGNGDSGMPQPQVQPQRGLLGQTLDAGLKAASDASLRSRTGQATSVDSASLRSHTEQPPASASVRPTVVAPSGAAQPQEWEDSPERQAFQMKVNAAKAGLKRQGDDFQQQIEGIQKGNKPGASKGELEIDPHTGRMDTAYYTAEGDRVDSRMQQSRANSEYHQWWENNTEAGKRSKEQRLQHEFEDGLTTLWHRHDLGETGNAAQRAWTAAEAEYDSAVERNRKNKAMISGVAMDNTDAAALSQLESVDNFTDRLTTHDLDALMDNAWKNLGSDGQKSLVDDCYRMLSQRYQGADELELYNYAKEMARQQSDLRMYRLAVEKNLPKGKLDYFMRKVGDMNLLTNIGKGIAVNRTGKTGDMAAYEAANEEYRQDGHKILDVAGMVVGFAFDPTMLLSGGVGGAATKGAMWAGGRYIAGRGASAAVVKGASREFAHTLSGRLAAGVVGGSANFGTFEGIKEMENQFAHGGHIVGQDESGRYINEGYSASAVGGQALHGLIMGGAVGWLGPVTGNVSDKLVKGTASTVGKVAARSGLYAGATVAEGTIFSIPEWYEGNRDGFDVWTDNMAMMVGFKAKHMLKSAGGVLGDLKASFEKPANGQKNRMDFASRLRMRMDAPSDGGLVTRDGRFVESLGLTKDEAAELSRYGYRDLRELVESSERTGDASKGALITANAPEIVSRLTDMVRDTRVSEAARAKMYYYATGRKLPMSMMMRGELSEDGNGGFTVKSYGANGVITSRSFKSRKRADLELERIRRQTELNSIEVGEWYQPIADFESRIMEASRRVAAKYDWRPIDVYRTFEDFLDSSVRGKDKELSDAQKNIYSKIIAELDGIEEDSDPAGKKRSAINEKYGVDIDKAIRKDLNRRTEAEQRAIEEYISALMPQRQPWNAAGQKLLPSKGEPRDVEDVGYREAGA